MFARYSLIGALSAAFGALAAALPEYFGRGGHRRADRDQVDVRRSMPCSASLAAFSTPEYPGSRHGRAGSRRLPLGPSRNIVYRLAALFSLDAFAGGFVVQSLLALWLFERFDLSLSAASLFFFWSGVLSAFSFPVAAWISPPHRPHQHDGVHAYPVEPLPDPRGIRADPARWHLALLLVRAALSQMDVPTRSSYVWRWSQLPSDQPRRASPPCRAASQRPPARRLPALCSLRHSRFCRS